MNDELSAVVCSIDLCDLEGFSTFHIRFGSVEMQRAILFRPAIVPRGNGPFRWIKIVFLDGFRNGQLEPANPSAALTFFWCSMNAKRSPPSS